MRLLGHTDVSVSSGRHCFTPSVLVVRVHRGRALSADVRRCSNSDGGRIARRESAWRRTSPERRPQVETSRSGGSRHPKRMHALRTHGSIGRATYIMHLQPFVGEVAWLSEEDEFVQGRSPPPVVLQAKVCCGDRRIGAGCLQTKSCVGLAIRRMISSGGIRRLLAYLAESS